MSTTSGPISDRRPSILAAEYVNFAFATIFILFRFMSRRLKRVNIWWDDYFALGCYATNVFWAVIIPLWVEKGIGMHIQDVTWITPAEAITKSKLYLYIGEIVYSVSLFFAKASLLLFYWRVFRVSVIKTPIIVLFVCSFIWFICRIFMCIFHCVPVRAYWDLTITDKRCDIDDKKFILGTVIVHVTIDFAIMILPVYQIHKLQLPRIQKAGIMVMFVLGIFVCVVALIIMVKTTKLDLTSMDVTWNLTDIMLWASAEVNLVTVSACLPTVRPALAYIFSLGKYQTSLASGPTSNGQSGNKGSVHLSVLRKSKTRDDEAGSTYQLADSVKNDSLSDFDAYAMDRIGVKTLITQGSFGNSRLDMESGIMVKNETSVRVSKPHP